MPSSNCSNKYITIKLMKARNIFSSSRKDDSRQLSKPNLGAPQRREGQGASIIPLKLRCTHPGSHFHLYRNRSENRRNPTARNKNLQCLKIVIEHKCSHNVHISPQFLEPGSSLQGQKSRWWSLTSERHTVFLQMPLALGRPWGIFIFHGS